MRKGPLIVAGFTKREPHELRQEWWQGGNLEGGGKKGVGFGDDVRPAGGRARLHRMLVNGLTS